MVHGPCQRAVSRELHTPHCTTLPCAMHHLWLQSLAPTEPVGAPPERLPETCVASPPPRLEGGAAPTGSPRDAQDRPGTHRIAPGRSNHGGGTLTMSALTPQRTRIHMPPRHSYSSRVGSSSSDSSSSLQPASVLPASLSASCIVHPRHLQSYRLTFRSAVPCRFLPKSYSVSSDM